MNHLKKIAALLLTLIVLMGLTGSALAANEYSWDVANNVLNVHGDSLSASDLVAALKEQYGSASLYRLNGGTQFSGTLPIGDQGFTHGTSYTVETKAKIYTRNWTSAGSFTAHIYDVLTIHTVKGGETTTTTMDVFRDQDAVFTVDTDSQYNVTIDYAGAYSQDGASVNLGKLTADAEVTITYTQDTDSTVVVGTVDQAEVTLGNATVPANTPKTFTVAPTGSNRYITSVTVTDESNASIPTTVTMNDGVWNVTFTTGAVKTVYTVNVETSEPVLALVEQPADGYLISYEDGMNTAAIRAELIKLIGTALDGVNDANLSVTYDALYNSWQVLDYQPSGFDALLAHAFGKNSSEKIRLTYTPANDAYPDVELEFTVVLSKKAAVKLAEDSSSVATVYAKSEGELVGTRVTADAPVLVPQNKTLTISVSPELGANNTYVSQVIITDADGQTYADLKMSSGTYSLELTLPTSDSYTVKAVTAPIFTIGTVEYNEHMTSDEVTANVIKALTGEHPSNIKTASLSNVSDGKADVAITYEDASGKYPTLMGYSYITLEDVQLQDSRPETELVLLGGDALAKLNKTYTGVYTNDQLLEQLFVQLQTKDGTVLTDTLAGFEHLTASAADATSFEAQTVTFTYADNVNYKGCENSVTFQLTKAPTDATVLPGTISGTSVQMSVNGGEPTALSAGGNSVPEHSSILLTVTPDDDKYIATVQVYLITEGMEDQLVTDAAVFNGRTASVSFTADTLQTYRVNVTAQPASLKLLNNNSKQQSINYTTMQDIAVAEAAIKALIDLENSDPVPTAANGTLEIKYLAGTVLNSDKWESLNYEPSGLNALAYHKFGAKNTEQVQITFTANDSRYPVTTTGVFEVTLNDPRPATSISLNEAPFTFTYVAEPNANTIISTLCNGVINAETGEQIPGAVVKLTACDKLPLSESSILKMLNAGTHTLTLTYEETSDYLGCSADVEITIERASAAIAVSAVNTTYTGKQIASPITVTAAAPNQNDDVAYITIVSGLDIHGEAFIHVDIPDALGVGGLIGNGVTISLKQVSSTLNSILGATDLDSATIDLIKNVIDTIANMEGLEDASVTLTMGQNIMPKDSGVYLIAGVISDSNYTTSANLNYAIIKPQAVEGKLAFNFEDENFVVLLSNLSSYDFGAHIVETGLTDSQIAWANEHIGYVYIGATVDGTPTISKNPPTQSGVYTQMAYILGVDNTDTVYAAPIVRPFIVVTEPVEVRFTTEERTFTYDRQPHGLNAAAYALTNGADVTNQGKLTVYYSGLETDGDVYGPTTTRPTECGVYNVTATFVSSDKTKAGIATTAMTITLSDEATITVDDKLHTYDGSAVKVSSMIKSSPSDAARTIITGAISVDGDFSENGFSALTGIINVDFPARVDKLLDRFINDRSLSVSDLLNAIDSLIKASDSKLDSDLLQAVRSVVAKLPRNASLTFHDNVSYTNIGTYLVVGVITDPNYTPKLDSGVLVIAPSVTSAELRWNYNDLNGIITRPVLDIIDLNASAFPKGSNQKDEALTARVEYVIVGMDDQGNTVVTDTTRNLPNGVYTQIAFIREGIGANMTLVKPIMRTFTLVPQTATVKVENKTVAYNGQQHSCSVTVTKSDGTAYDPASLAVTYIGLDAASGWYNSTTAPVNVGAYMVVAEYEEYAQARSRGELKYIGGDVGYLTITPAGAFDIADETTHYYDGTEKFVDIVANPDHLPYISIIRDAAGNVNIVFPASWNAPQMSTGNVQADLNTLRVWLQAHAPQDVQNSEVFTTLMNALQSISIHSLSINGQLPIELGDYNVICIAYGSNQGVMVDKGVLHIIEDPTATPTPAPVTPAPEPTVDPNSTPTADPNATPTADPNVTPTVDPNATPTVDPNATPTVDPDATPTVDPNATPTANPNATPTVDPNATPTANPNATPTMDPDATPTVDPNVTPTVDPDATPTVDPNVTPTVDPNATPTADPNVTPTVDPDATPTVDPDATPTVDPDATPTVDPNVTPTVDPNATPTANPNVTPTVDPNATPTANPNVTPTVDPDATPSMEPSDEPTASPTAEPTATPTVEPTATPEPDDFDLPQTGDQSNPTLWIALILFSAVGLMVLLTGRRKNYNH